MKFREAGSRSRRATPGRPTGKQHCCRICVMHDHAQDSGAHHDADESVPKHSDGDRGQPHGGGGHFHSHGLGDGYQLSGRMTGVLGASVAATFLLVFGEMVAGYLGHSIALISDAIHNLTDVPSLVISWLAIRWAARPPTPEKTYGYHRAGILAAFVNAVLLSLAAVFLIYESVDRLRHPVEVHAAIMLWISLLALAINGGITL